MRALASAILYLLLLDGVACALLAWGDATALDLVLWALALGAVGLVGERLATPFSAIEMKRRDKIAVFLGTIQLSLLVLALVLAAVKPRPDLLGFLSDVLAGYALVVLGLRHLTPHPRGVVGHALALITLAALRGGGLGAWAVSSALGLTGLFLGLDHHIRLLSAHRIDDGPYTALAFWRTAVLVVPVAVFLGLAVARLAPEAAPVVVPDPVEEGYVPLEDEKGQQELDLKALRALLLAAIAGAVAIYAVGRWLARSKGGEVQSIETPEPLRGGLERIRREAKRTRALPEYPGRRGRIVRAYLNLLRGAERAGFPRRPSETPEEFASALGEPRTSLGSITETFARARYGPGEPTDADVHAAEGGVDAVLGRLARQPPKRRRVVRDADERRADES
ncbi:MAG: DUF4129 domain-containing protein [Acidobacteria bacterium]|nr:DUF4129 domain-containing protein [Acidobacteriota bacterium]